MDVVAHKTVHVTLDEDEAKELETLLGQRANKNTKMTKLWEGLNKALYGDES